MPAGSVGSCKPLSLSWRLLHHSSLILSLIGSSLVSDEPLWEGREDNSLGQQKAFMQKPNAEASSERAALGGTQSPLQAASDNAAPWNAAAWHQQSSSRTLTQK